MVKLDKIKEFILKYIKNRYVQIGLAVAVVLIVVLIICFSCSKNDGKEKESNIKATVEATTEATEKPESTSTPASTATPEATEEAVVTEEPVDNDTSSETIQSENNMGNQSGSDTTTQSSGQINTNNAPVYTQVPSPMQNPTTYATYGYAYSTLLSYTHLFGSLDYSKYYLYDMNKDGVEELIIHYGTGDQESTIDVYTCSNGELVHIGETFGSYATVCGNSAEEGIIIYYRRDGWENINGAYIYDGEIVTTEITSGGHVDAYVDLPESVTLQSYAITDLTPLNGK